MEHEPAAEADHDRRRGRREEVDEREVEAVQHDRLLVRLAVVRVHVLEALLVARLARERLHDAHPGDVLGERRRDEPEPLAHLAVRAGRPRAEHASRDHERRDHRHRRERELPVEEEEDDRGADQRQRALHERRHAVGDELVERVDVVREAADHDARAVALVEAERQPLEVAEEVVAEVGEDALAGPAGEVRLRRAGEEACDARGEHQYDQQGQELEIAAGDALVDRDLREVRRDQAGQRREQERDHRERRAQPVALRVAGEEADPADRRAPRPVAHLAAALHRQVAAWLPHSHLEHRAQPRRGRRATSPRATPLKRDRFAAAVVAVSDIVTRAPPLCRRTRARAGRARRSRGRRGSSRAADRASRVRRPCRGRARRARRRARGWRGGAR